MNPETTDCPHCGARKITHPLDKTHTILECGSVEGWRTPLCHEREDHNKTKEDLSIVISAILKKDDKDIINKTAMERLAELHKAEKDLYKIKPLSWFSKFHAAQAENIKLLENNKKLRGIIEEIKTSFDKNNNTSDTSALDKVLSAIEKELDQK